jgi:hypothetical protein
VSVDISVEVDVDVVAVGLPVAAAVVDCPGLSSTGNTPVAAAAGLQL